MYKHNIAVKWGNGDVEGFSGIGFDIPAAKKDADKKLQEKIGYIKGFYPNQPPSAYMPTKLKGFSQVTKEQKKQIQNDWRM